MSRNVLDFAQKPVCSVKISKGWPLGMNVCVNACISLPPVPKDGESFLPCWVNRIGFVFHCFCLYGDV